MKSPIIQNMKVGPVIPIWTSGLERTDQICLKKTLQISNKANLIRLF